MTTFTVARNAFTTTVTADDAKGAILAMVQEAGYETIAQAAAVLGESEEDFIDAQIVTEVDGDDDGSDDDSFRACYYVAEDRQSDVLLTSEDQAGLADEELIEAAIAEARDSGLIDYVADVRDLSLIEAEQAVRGQLTIGSYRR